MKLIIINQSQFGHHIDTYYYCKYLKDYFALTYICWDHGFPKIEIDGVRVVYVRRGGNILVRTMRFLRDALAQINDKRAIVFIKYFKGVSLVLRLLRPTHCFVLDIRTGSVHKNKLARRFHDARLKLETRFFRHVTVISQSLAEKLGIAQRAHILPLGADIISSVDKSFDKLSLLYVGTLFNRNIDVTIHGFKKFYEEYKNQIPISYTIVGSGLNNEEQDLRKLAERYSLTKIVNVTGRIPHTQLKPWFDSANVGVSYIPMTDYYDVQPATKTFEYLLSGLAVLGTSTYENKLVINETNGILTNDTADDFCSGLVRLLKQKEAFNSKEIRKNALKFSWEKITNNLDLYLSSLLRTP